jgi:hypothetical protein
MNRMAFLKKDDLVDEAAIQFEEKKEKEKKEDNKVD